MRRLSIALMMITIATIVAFQVYWLQRNYQEERKLLTARANLLFRETVLNAQSARLKLDTNVDLQFKHGPELGMLSKVINYKLAHDSAESIDRGHALVVIRHDSTEESRSLEPPRLLLDPRPDPADPRDERLHLNGAFKFDSKRSKESGNVVLQSANFKVRVVGFLSGLDSLQKPVPVEEINARFRRELDKEKLNVPFRITRYAADSNTKKFFFKTETEEAVSIEGVSTDNAVTIGFKHPFVYQMDLDGVPWYILRKMAQQILFSLVLVAVTILSFFLLFRNWQQQKRLTQVKNDFISNITHELKTPIATVSVAVEALRNFNALDDPRRTREYLDISAGELQRLSLLVDKVLKLSLFEKEEIELKKDQFNLKELVEEVAASMRLQFEKYQAKLLIHPEGPDFSLRADKLHITSVVYNLLDNALKYSKAQPFVEVGLRSETEQLVLSVTDNGIGIPSVYRKRVFEKFFRVPTGDRHNVKGYGLGLSYVAYVLQRQGGEISVESEPGVGSVFTVKIPRDHV